MTKYQLRLLVNRIPNVLAFCAKTGIPHRTVSRLRDKTNPHKPTARTIARLQKALESEGILTDDEKEQHRARAARAAARK